MRYGNDLIFSNKYVLEKKPYYKEYFNNSNLE